MKMFTTLLLALTVALFAMPAMAADAMLTMPGFNVQDMGLIGVGFAGMIVNKQSLSTIFINLKTTFNKAFESTESMWQKIAMLVPSGSSQNDYKWLSNFPQMRKWIGEKNIKSLEGFSYTIVNDDFEVTVEVDRNHIEDDTLGIYAPQTQMAGYSAKQLPDEIVIELVNNGHANLCYDGQNFFDTDHPVNDASVSNKGTVALSIATLAAAKASYGLARTKMKQFKDDEGRPLNISPNILLVGPALGDDARSLMTDRKSVV